MSRLPLDSTKGSLLRVQSEHNMGTRFVAVGGTCPNAKRKPAPERHSQSALLLFQGAARVALEEDHLLRPLAVASEFMRSNTTVATMRKM